MSAGLADYIATPPAWRGLMNEINGGRIPDGERGIRDVDAPCESFVPTGAPYELSLGGGDCETDGHYICKECVHISLSTLRARLDQCRECGEKLVHAGTKDEDCSARCASSRTWWNS